MEEISLLERLAHLLSPAWRSRWRVFFWVYAAALFTGTHIPRFQLEVPGIERPDLIIHLLAFGGWFGTFWLAAYVPPKTPRSWRAIGACVVVACVYAGVDELLQGIPGLNRTVAWDDYGCNVLGILLGAAIASILHAVAPPSPITRAVA